MFLPFLFQRFFPIFLLHRIHPWIIFDIIPQNAHYSLCSSSIFLENIPMIAFRIILGMPSGNLPEISCRTFSSVFLAICKHFSFRFYFKRFLQNSEMISFGILLKIHSRTNLIPEFLLEFINVCLKLKFLSNNFTRIIPLILTKIPLGFLPGISTLFQEHIPELFQ